MYGSPEALAKRVSLLRGFYDQAGRDFDEIELSIHSDLAITSTRGDADELMSRTVAKSGQDIGSQRDMWITGTPSEVVEQLGRYADIGVSHWIIHIHDPFDERALRLLRDEVVPAFR